MVTAKQVINSIKPNITKIPQGATQKGSAGYDNPREDIEKIKGLKEGSIQKVPVNADDITNKAYVDAQFPVTHASTTGQTTDQHHAQSHSHASHTSIGIDDHHAQTHTIVSHDTTGTGANVTTLTDNSMADTLHRHSELSASDGTPDQAVYVDATGNVGIGTTGPASKLHVTGAGSADTVLTLGTQDSTPYIKSVNNNLIIQADVQNLFLRTAAGKYVNIDTGSGLLVSGNVGIGTTGPTAKAHIDQSSTTAAIPVLTLDQADISEEMIEFVTTIGTGNAIEAAAAKTLTTTHFIKVTIPGGLTRYIPCGTIA